MAEKLWPTSTPKKYFEQTELQGGHYISTLDACLKRTPVNLDLRKEATCELGHLDGKNVTVQRGNMESYINIIRATSLLSQHPTFHFLSLVAL